MGSIAIKRVELRYHRRILGVKEMGFRLGLVLLLVCCMVTPTLGVTARHAAKPAATPRDACVMIHIPAERFGADRSDSSEKGGHAPLGGYSIGKYEVTRGQFRRFIDAGGYSQSKYWSDEGWRWRNETSRTEPAYWGVRQNWKGDIFTQTDAHPVVGVTWYEAEAFCTWAGGHLPTSAQWRKAAGLTGGRHVAFPWGDDTQPEYWNNLDDHNAAGGGYHRSQTAPIGSYPQGASPYGCEDMAGNVSEWCDEWESQLDFNEFKGPGAYFHGYKVLGGPGWDEPSNTPTGVYFFYPITHYTYAIGFRLVREDGETAKTMPTTVVKNQNRKSDTITAYKRIIAKTNNDKDRVKAFRGIYAIYARDKRYDDMARLLMCAEEWIVDRKTASYCIPPGAPKPTVKAMENALMCSEPHPVSLVIFAGIYKAAGNGKMARGTLKYTADQCPRDSGALRLVIQACQSYPDLKPFANGLRKKVAELERTANRSVRMGFRSKSYGNGL